MATQHSNVQIKVFFFFLLFLLVSYFGAIRLPEIATKALSKSNAVVTETDDAV